MSKIYNILCVSSDSAFSGIIQATLIEEELKTTLEVVTNQIDLTQMLLQRGWDALIVEYPSPISQTILTHNLLRHVGSPVPLLVVSNHADSNARKWTKQIGACDLIDRENLWRLSSTLRREQYLIGLRIALHSTRAKLNEQTHNLRERIKELTCLYRISKLAEQQKLSRAQFIEKLLQFVPKSWQYPSAARARIKIYGEEYSSLGFVQTPWIQTADIIGAGKVIGSLEICYRKKCPEADEGPFLIEERKLIATIGKHIGDVVTSKEAQETLLRQQKLLEASQAAVRSFSAKILAAREEERKNIANTLHDELGSIAVLLGSKLKVAEENAVKGDGAEIIGILTDIRMSFVKSIEGIKQLAKDLRPPNFEALGLAGALEDLTVQLADDSGIPIHLKIDPHEANALEAELAITLYRIAQEAINNAIEHSGASGIFVRLVRRGENVRLTIRDDGKGFLPASAGIWTKTGLQGIHERCAHLDGTVSIDSLPGKGTEISVLVPLAPGDHKDELP